MARHSPAPALDRAAGHGQTCGAAGLGAAYVGEDWVLVVDGVADYARSEAIAPFLLLAQPGMRLTVHTPLGLLTDTTVTRHRAGSLSNVPAPAPEIPPAYRAAAGSARAVWPGAAWWRGFGSGTLDGLIEAAQGGNFDIQAAVARVRAAVAHQP
mgnify:CR=1 FL=1